MFEFVILTSFVVHIWLWFHLIWRLEKKLTQNKSDRNEKYAVQKGHQNVSYYWFKCMQN